MPIIKNTYKIGKLQQLIDLNQDNTNFKAEFKVSSKTDKPFMMLVTSQSQLDDPNVNNLEFKEVKGYIGGNIIADKNIFQNYFVVLKSDDDQEVELEVILEPLPDNIPQQQQHQQQQQPQPQPQHPSQQTSNIIKPPEPQPRKNFLKSKYFIWILVGVAVLALLYLLYTSYYNSSSEKGHSPSPSRSIRSIDNSPRHTPKPSPAHTPVHSPVRARSSPSSIISRLKSTRIKSDL